jgi:membrane associated rhomboid family serine protease
MIQDAARFRVAVWWSAGILLLLWTVKAVEQATDIDLGFLGIYPQKLHGLVGVITSPFVHGDIFHLLSNSIPLGILVFSIIFFFPGIAMRVLTLIYLITGLCVWILAREAYHIGASGVVYGLLSYFLFSGFIRKDTGSLAISFVVIILYGTSFFTGLLPTQYHISFESHILGALVGLAAAIYWCLEPMAGQEPISPASTSHDESDQEEGGPEAPVSDSEEIYPFPTDRFPNEGK